jgi:hypothetical protein
LAIAGRLATNDEISAVHVVSNDRPTYDELLRYHRWADGNDLKLSVDATSVSFRSNPLRVLPSYVEAPTVPAWPSHLADHVPWRDFVHVSSQGTRPMMNGNLVSSALGWLGAHSRAWYGELNLMNEGTR